MRTSDRTYAQKLGFSDPDRHNEIHNAAAIYLTAKPQIEKFAKLFLMELTYEGEWGDWHDFDPRCGGLYSEDRQWPTSLGFGFGERLKWQRRKKSLPSSLASTYSVNTPIIQRANSGYTNIIGYLDALINIKMTYPERNEYRVTNMDEALASYGYDSGKEKIIKDAAEKFKKEAVLENTLTGSESESIGIEIKHGFVDVSSVIQQISTYRAFADLKYVLCTLYPINEVYKKVLKDHKIKHIYVSPQSVEKFMSAKGEAQEEF